MVQKSYLVSFSMQKTVHEQTFEEIDKILNNKHKNLTMFNFWTQMTLILSLNWTNLINFTDVKIIFQQQLMSSGIYTLINGDVVSAIPQSWDIFRTDSNSFTRCIHGAPWTGYKWRFMCLRRPARGLLQVMKGGSKPAKMRILKMAGHFNFFFIIIFLPSTPNEYNTVEDPQ